MRIAKYLAHAGVASRRRAEQMIDERRVAVNGRVLDGPVYLVEDGDQITVDGMPIGGSQSSVVYIVDKPKGVVSTADDPQGRPTVVQMVKDSRRLYPVGRLDLDTTGLILLTNDGQLAYRLTHPRFEVERTYNARLKPARISPFKLKELSDGVELEDGITAPAKLRRLEDGLVQITLREGRNRQVRRMFEAVGHRVVDLRRVAFGPLEIGRSEPGNWRRLSGQELDGLRKIGQV